MAVPSSSFVMPPPLPSAARTRSRSVPPNYTRLHGKAKKPRDRERFCKGYKGDGVVYLPGDINGLTKKSQFLHLHNSYLLIEGEVLKADYTRYADADLIALTNNWLLYLFFSLKLTLA